jgi:uncharacterized protein YqjF (DUF2071 family)
VTSVFLTAEWRDLAMVNYEIEPEALAGLVPRGTELDDFRGRTLVSLVGFRFLRTRVLGVPVPFHRDFEELNLRFYVRRRSGEEIRRGVVFVQELVPKRAIAWVARTVYNENYVAVPMRHRITGERDGGPRRVEYGWLQHGQWSHLRVESSAAPALPAPDSEAAFVTEHYWGYVRQRDGSTVEYRVEHPPWRVAHGGQVWLEGDLEALYGPRFAKCLSRSPVSAFLAEGSPVVVRRGRSVS